MATYGMLPEHSYEPGGWGARVGKFACRVAGVAVVLAAPVGRWIVLAKNSVWPKYASSLVVLSIDRVLDSDRERLAGLVGDRWHSPVVPSPRWMGVVQSPVPSTDADLPIERGTYWFANVTVAPGTEPFAVALIRLDAIAALKFGQVRGWGRVPDTLWAARWPNWELDAPALIDTLTGDAYARLARRAAVVGTTASPRIAVVDTAFRPPPTSPPVQVVVDQGDDSDDEQPLQRPPPAPHGAMVCSLILGSCPTATIRLYPVLRERDAVDGQAVLVALQLIGMTPEVDLVNLSLSVTGSHYPRATRELLEHLFTTIRGQHPTGSTVFVAATGNEDGRPRMKLPARLPSTVAVGCVDPAGAVWHRSCGGSKRGYTPHRWLVSCGTDLTYDDDGGTSYAAASVTGLLAVLVSQGSDPLDAAEELLNTADADLPEYSPDTHGVGRARLMQAAPASPID